MTTQATGRVSHPHKITIYLSADELLRLEYAAAQLRIRDGIKVDRGHVVREALGMVLDDYDDAGKGDRMSRLEERLRGIR